MEPKRSNTWLIGALAAAILSVLLAYFGLKGVPDVSEPGPTPTVTASPIVVTPMPEPTASATPTPTPTPTPTATASAGAVMTSGFEKPAPENAYAPKLSSSLALKLGKNEVTGRIVKVKDGCYPVPSYVTVYKMVAIKTTQPSFKGAMIGDHYDPLIEAPELCGPGWFWLDFKTPAATTTAKIGDLTVSIEVTSFVAPTRPTIPFYVGLQPYSILLAHKLPGTSGVNVQGPLVKKYVDLLRAHRIEPFAQAIASPKLLNGEINIDEWASSGASWRQLVLDGSIAPPMAFYGPFASVTWSQQKPEIMSAWEKKIQAEPGLKDAWVYVTDEPSETNTGGNYDPGFTKTIERAKFIKTYAPSMKTMVTKNFDDRLKPVIDSFVPQFESFGKLATVPGYWMYGACPSHGSCANGYVGTPTGTPDLMIDQPSIHYRAFPLVAARLGAKAALYYTATEAFGRIDPWTSVYQFGGNGDGVLVYPGIKGERGFIDQTAVGSIRLKLIREGMFDIEHSLAKLSTVIQDVRTWNKDHAAYDALR